VVGLAFPVVPKGDDTIRFQLNAAHTEQDVADVLSILAEIR
jgi:glycine C-acetyltransferase